MQKATYAFIASQLVTKKEIEDVSKLFRGIDDDNDGKLDKEELKKIYFNHYGKHLTDTELNQIYDKIDIDGSGKIDYSEFVVASMNEKELLSKEKLQAAFSMFDSDGGGFISKSELREVLQMGQNFDSNMIEKIFEEADADKDGQISFDEFVQMMKGTILQK